WRIYVRGSVCRPRQGLSGVSAERDRPVEELIRLFQGQCSCSARVDLRRAKLGRIAYRPETKSGSHTTLRWRGQSRANPSLKPKFPASRENAGNFIDSGLRGVSMVAKTRRQISNLRVNSL